MHIYAHATPNSQTCFRVWASTAPSTSKSPLICRKELAGTRGRRRHVSKHVEDEGKLGTNRATLIACSKEHKNGTSTEG